MWYYMDPKIYGMLAMWPIEGCVRQITLYLTTIIFDNLIQCYIYVVLCSS